LQEIENVVVSVADVAIAERNYLETEEVGRLVHAYLL
jgi:hypothetical protein